MKDILPIADRLPHRKREHTASESETDSQKRSRPPLSIPPTVPILPAILEAENLPPLTVTINRPISRGAGNDASRTATKHDLPQGPGWIQVEDEEKDGLDEMITGVKQGGILEEVSHSFKSGLSVTLTSTMVLGRK